MARIRIIDEWLRSPVSPPTRHRAIMVIADSWSEQRVLMRAFAASEDQTRPTIVLHGAVLAIGPAGTDPHGHWGIHVEPPADGRAQELRGQLELAAKRLAGTKGNPPRLVDEESRFERKPTNNWAPGAPRDRMTLAGVPAASGSYEPSKVAAPESSPVIPSAAPRVRSSPGIPNPASSSSNNLRSSPGLPSKDSSVDIVPVADRRTVFASNPAQVIGAPPPPAPGFAVAAYAAAPPPPPTPVVSTSSAPALLAPDTLVDPPRPLGMPAPPRRKKGWTNPLPVSASPTDRAGFDGTKTTPGFASMAAPVARPVTSAGASQSMKQETLASLVGHTMPLGFRLSSAERDVLNALGKTDRLRASEIARIINVDNAIQWMDDLMTKLAEHGLDLVIPGDDATGEPTYILRR